MWLCPTAQPRRSGGRVLCLGAGRRCCGGTRGTKATCLWRHGVRCVWRCPHYAHGGAASAVTGERGQCRVRARCSCSPSALRWGCESSEGSPVCCDNETQWGDEESPEPFASQRREAMRQGTASQLWAQLLAPARARAHAVPAGEDAGAADAAAAPYNALADQAAHIVQHDRLFTHEAALRRLMADDGRLCKPHEGQGLAEPERLHREQSSGTPVPSTTVCRGHPCVNPPRAQKQRRSGPAASYASGDMGDGDAASRNAPLLGPRGPPATVLPRYLQSLVIWSP